MAAIIKNCEHCNKIFATNTGFINKIFCSHDCNFDHYYIPGDPDKCWEWLGKKDAKGYGGFGAQEVAYRYSYRRFVGPTSKGKVIRHLCNNPGCVNPNHLMKGTYQENSQDSIKAGTHKPMRGMLNGVAKLTDSQVLEIYNSPQDYKDVATQYDISKARVRDIRAGRGWNHVTGAPQFKPKRIYKPRIKI